MVCIFPSLLALFLKIASQISHLIPSFSFLFTKLLQKAFDGWGAANSEGWDIESCEYDVSWMDGVEDLANEVRIYVTFFIVTFLYKIPDIFSDFIWLLSFCIRCSGR